MIEDPKDTKVLLSDMSWFEVREVLKSTDLIIIPFGANEVYGKHLQTGSDTIVALEISLALARKVGAVVAPPIPVGYSHALLDFPGTISADMNILTSLLRDYCRSLIRHGFQRFFIACGHLGNISAITSAAYDLHGRALFAMVDLWRFLAKEGEGIVETNCFPEGHASEIGTSVLLALRPDLVRMEMAVKEVPGPHLPHTPHDVNLFYTMGELTKSGVIGDPLLASAEKGRKILEKATVSLGKFLKEFKVMDLKRDTIFL